MYQKQLQVHEAFAHGLAGLDGNEPIRVAVKSLRGESGLWVRGVPGCQETSTVVRRGEGPREKHWVSQADGRCRPIAGGSKATMR